MKYTPEAYAKVFGELAGEGADVDALIRRFAATVRRNGDFSKMDAIVKAIERRQVKASGGRIVSVEFARAATAAMMRAVRDRFTPKDKLTFSVSPTLVAGVRVTVDGEWEFDGSLERKLKTLFKNN